MWTEKFASMTNNYPTRYVRMNPMVDDSLPDLDKVDALRSGGELAMIASNYLNTEDTRCRLDGIYQTLVATSFYFNVIERPHHLGTGEFVNGMHPQVV
jgi:hypothetical protein